MTRRVASTPTVGHAGVRKRRTSHAPSPWERGCLATDAGAKDFIMFCQAGPLVVTKCGLQEGGAGGTAAEDAPAGFGLSGGGEAVPPRLPCRALSAGGLQQPSRQSTSGGSPKLRGGWTVSVPATPVATVETHKDPVAATATSWAAPPGAYVSRLAALRRAGGDTLAAEVSSRDCSKERDAGKRASRRRSSARSKERGAEAKLPQEGLLVDLLKFTLRDKNDTVESLTKTMEEVKRGKEEAASLHATCHVADRVVQVMEKKLEVLEQLRQKVESYQQATRDVEQILRRAIDGDDLSAEGMACEGIQKFVSGLVGDPPEFNDMVDWPYFVRNIRLPKGHAAVVEATTLLAQGEEEWAAVALRLCGAEVDTVLLPKEERLRRHEERKKRRIFMRAFPEVLDGTTPEQVEAVLERVKRGIDAACSFGSLTEKSQSFTELSKLAEDLQVQSQVLREGGTAGVKIDLPTAAKAGTGNSVCKTASDGSPKVGTGVATAKAASQFLAAAGRPVPPEVAAGATKAASRFLAAVGRR